MQRKELIFDVLVPSHLGRLSLYCDDARVVQVLVGLVFNAKKFTPAGGRVQLTVSLQEKNICFSVIDSGCGFDGDGTDLFKPLVQVEAERAKASFVSYSVLDTQKKRMEGGFGLGLAIAKDLAELMHGKMFGLSKVVFISGCVGFFF